METLIIVLGFVIPVIISVFGFFLKRSFNKIDECATKSELKEYQDDIKNLSSKIDDFVTRPEFKECQLRTKELSNRFASKEEVTEIKARMEKLEQGIDYLKENTVRKEDFVRLLGRLENKIDKLIER